MWEGREENKNIYRKKDCRCEYEGDQRGSMRKERETGVCWGGGNNT